VLRQLRAHLPHGSTATLCAVDGAVTAGLAGQLRDIGSDATNLIVSTDGNNPRQNIALLTQCTGTRAGPECVFRLASRASSQALVRRSAR